MCYVLQECSIVVHLVWHSNWDIYHKIFRGKLPPSLISTRRIFKTTNPSKYIHKYLILKIYSFIIRTGVIFFFLFLLIYIKVNDVFVQNVIYQNKSSDIKNLIYYGVLRSCYCTSSMLKEWKMVICNSDWNYMLYLKPNHFDET